MGASDIATRLNIFLVQRSLLLEGKLLISQIMTNLVFYHKPILLFLKDVENLGPIPFWFSPQWIYVQGFMEIVENDWNITVIGSPRYVWEKNLKIPRKL